VRDKVLAIETELNAQYFERKEVIRGLLVGLLTQQHVLLLGPPGTAKSMLANDICSRIGGQYFHWLLARTSTPEELFGPVSLKALEQDSYRRITTGKLPEATVAFVDEIFKCNSAVLNTMLSVLNERLFFNDGTPTTVPLQMAVGASNELPEDREELGALWDRFMLRYVVQSIRDPRNFEKLLSGTTQTISSPTTLTAAELEQARKEISAVDVSKILPRITELRQKIVLELSIEISDRRWNTCMALVKAQAWLEGRKAAADDDLEILTAALWTEPGQQTQVRQAIMSLANPFDQDALDLYDQAIEIYHEAITADDEKATAIGTEANAKLKRITGQLVVLEKKANEAGKGIGRIEEIKVQIAAWNREVINKCLGIEV